MALIGCARVGLGIAIIFPPILSAAARSREVPSGTALAAVSTLGSVAHSTTIGIALWLVALFYVGIAAPTRSVGGGEGVPHTSRSPRPAAHHDNSGTGIRRFDADSAVGAADQRVTRQQLRPVGWRVRHHSSNATVSSPGCFADAYLRT